MIFLKKWVELHNGIVNTYESIIDKSLPPNYNDSLYMLLHSRMYLMHYLM